MLLNGGWIRLPFRTMKKDIAEMYAFRYVASCVEIATPRSAWLTIHPLPLNGQNSTFEKDTADGF